MWFWIKNLILMVILIGAAAFLMISEDLSFSGTEVKEKPPTRGRVTQPTSKTTAEIAKEEAENDTFTLTTSSAASGLSNFYGKIKEDLLGNSKTMGDGFVIRIEPSIYTLDEQLQRRANMVQPGSRKFTGEKVNRNFRVGDTLREKLATAAEEEGMELIWRLDRDYVIKYYFQVESNLLGVVGTVASALDNDFEKDVFAYYCFNERALVITHDPSAYVKGNCRLVTGKSQ